jgi:putative hydrolase of the HAD superfamily
MLHKDRLSAYITPLVPLPTSMKPRGSLDNAIGCVMFDVYGTIFISGSGDIGALRNQPAATDRLARLLYRYGIEKSPAAFLQDFFEQIEKIHALRKKEGVLYPEVRIEHIWMEVLNCKDLEIVSNFSIEFELIVNPVFPMPHLREMLTACRRRKLLLGLISNAQFYTPLLFGWLLGEGLDELGFHPDLVFFSYLFGVAKPSRMLFDHARKRLTGMGVRAHEVLYVGNDMLNDIGPASYAGFKTALFAGDARSLRLRENEPECKGLVPDLVITDLIQILDYI